MTPDEAQGVGRTRALGAAQAWIEDQRLLTDEAETTAVLLTPMQGKQAAAWQRRELLRGEDWAFVTSKDGSVTTAIDEPSEAGQLDPSAAVVFPELHSRLVAWWLVHSWRLTDLLESSIRDLHGWRITTAAVLARATLEETGCLLYELRMLDAAWAEAKASAASASPLEKASIVHAALAPVLTKATFGSRMEISHEKLQATNVWTYVQKLAKAAARPEVNEWYDWLSDAAHPAAGARIALASQPVQHDTGALSLRCFARRPVPVIRRDGQVRGTDFTIAHMAADATIVCHQLGRELLEHGLWLVDDFGLTTAAATLTRRVYWRALMPVKGSRACPCGRGRASDCGHRWGAPGKSFMPSPVAAVPAAQEGVL